MWYEILPTMLIIAVAVGFPNYNAALTNLIWLGNIYRRSLMDQTEMYQYIRDIRLMKNPYKVAGLESIPDEEETEPPKAKATSQK